MQISYTVMCGVGFHENLWMTAFNLAVVMIKDGKSLSKQESCFHRNFHEEMFFLIRDVFAGNIL